MQFNGGSDNCSFINNKLQGYTSATTSTYQAVIYSPSPTLDNNASFIGNSIEGSASLLRPGYTMASIIANEFAEAVSKMHTQALIEVGLVLFFMTLLLNAFARLLVWQVARKTPQEARA